MSRKFGILRFIGNVYKVIGVILAIIAILAALGVCLTSLLSQAALSDLTQILGTPNLGFLGPIGGIIAGLAILIGIGIAAISQYAIGEAIFLFIAVEENTRATAAFLQRQLNG
jgi:hypothetical protein